VGHKNGYQGCYNPKYNKEENDVLAGIRAAPLHKARIMDKNQLTLRSAFQKDLVCCKVNRALG